MTIRNERLVIRKKPAWIVDDGLVELYEWRAKHSMTSQLIPSNPFDFHVRYYWDEKIDYTVVNPDVDASWAPIESEMGGLQYHSGGAKQKLRKIMLSTFRKVFSQRKRNRNIDLLPYLRCPKCFSSEFSQDKKYLICKTCDVRYVYKHDLFVMQPHVEGGLL